MDQFHQNNHTTSHRMNRKAIIIAIVLFVLIVAGMFTFAFLKKNEMIEEVQQQTEEPKTEVKYAAITRVDATHFYADGVHTLVGEILMPTPCDLLEAEVMVAESLPEQIFVDFSVLNTADFCAQTITPQRFKVTAPASEEATFTAKFMGRAVELNLIPAGSGETPDDFELFIKG
ncbi:MAG: hypothetical protein ACI9H6_000834 [Patiriisocius sp.]|jgi:hypothetical protein